MTPKNAKYLVKSATRTLRQRRAEFGGPSAVRSRRAFHHERTRNMYRDVEEDYWSVLMKLVFLKHALVARKLRKASEFSHR